VGTETTASGWPELRPDQLVLPHQPSLARCYEARLAEAPTTAGRLALTLSVAEDGSVRTARPTGELAADTSLVACLGREAQRWRLPPPHGPRASLTLTLQLEPIVVPDLADHLAVLATHGLTAADARAAVRPLWPDLWAAIATARHHHHAIPTEPLAGTVVFVRGADAADADGAVAVDGVIWHDPPTSDLVDTLTGRLHGPPSEPHDGWPTAEVRLTLPP